MDKSDDNLALDRFVNRMTDIITKYADVIDWDELPDPIPEAEIINISVSFFVWQTLIGSWNNNFKFSKYFGIFRLKYLYKKGFES